MRHSKVSLGARVGSALLGICVLLLPALAAAQDTSVAATLAKFGNAIDGGADYGWTIDGTFDTLVDTYDPVTGVNIVKVTRSDGDDFQHKLEKRGVWEFEIPAAVKQPGVTITGAFIEFSKSSYGTVTLTGADVLRVSGYAGDGTLALADFAQVGNTLYTTQNNAGPYFDVDATAYVKSIAATASHVGFVVSVDTWDTEYQLNAYPTLYIQYNVPANLPPVVTITSPASGSQFATGAAITFTATSVDPEGGPVSMISWFDGSGPAIGYGSSITLSSLSAGAHTIVAYSQDDQGNGAQASVAITVAAPNAPPSVTITAPAANAQFVAGTTITFQGSTADPEGGPVSAITWSSSLSGVIGTGSSVSTSTLPVGTHVITAAATDNQGLAGQATRTITVVSPPPPSTYCDARGTTSYEYANKVAIGTWSNTSGNNGGYANLTTLAAAPVYTGSNSVVLTPGFVGSAYTETWRVWIDLNHDLNFSADELVFSGSGTSAVSGTMSIPTTALTGSTRMRVAMKYGSAASPCGSFTDGEVEDYTVSITAGSPPPPPPATYCTSKGTTSSMEWIQQTIVAGISRVSGNNAGYADFTAATPIGLSRTAFNNFTLSPGFSGGSYGENWRVWIDYNHDSVFSDSELVYSGTSSLPVSSGFMVPAGALSGKTRMRISMSYGTGAPACGTFSYGEVEDYSVSIP